VVMAQRDALLRFIDAFNAADDDALDPLVTPDYVHHNNADELTLAQFKRGAAWFRRALPDFRIDVHDVVESGDRIAVRYTATGTHSASMFGEVPTGATLKLFGMMLCRFEDGLIAEDWEHSDEGDLRRQAGALPEA
jgi:steroid delta-isomerase-like uncharacterized protein